MAYQSEADQWRERFEQQKAVSVVSAIRIADLQYWNVQYAEELLRVRRDLVKERNLNYSLKFAYGGVLYLTLLVTIWNFM